MMPDIDERRSIIRDRKAYAKENNDNNDGYDDIIFFDNKNDNDSFDDVFDDFD
jgi:hypothetical protein